MRENLIIFISLSAVTLVSFYFSLSNFFAQDDFILINQFSQNNLAVDIKNAFGFPEVTHWRPIHNLYFLITGNVFGKNYLGYHLVTFFIHVSSGFLIYKIAQKIISRKAAFFASLFYVLNPSHFIALTWISGAAVNIGVLSFLASFYSLLKRKDLLALIFSTVSLLASEAMIATVFVFLIWGLLFKELAKRRFYLHLILISLGFILVKISFFTGRATFDAYPINLNFEAFNSIRYYLLRIQGFPGIKDDKFINIILMGWTAILTLIFLNRFNVNKKFFFFGSIVFFGLFPFILIPSHLSPHYMALSISGFSLLVGSVLAFSHTRISIAIFMIFLLSASLSIQLIKQDNWVINRAKTAKLYLQLIEDRQIAVGSTIVFSDSKFSSSEEVYHSLGTGEALKFWFPQKKYRACFVRFENCIGYQLP